MFFTPSPHKERTFQRKKERDDKTYCLIRDDELINDIIHVNSIIFYESVLYSLKNIESITINSDSDKRGKEKTIWEWIVKIWNSGIFGKILVIIIFVILAIPFIYLLSFLVKLIRKVFENKKNKPIGY